MLNVSPATYEAPLDSVVDPRFTVTEQVVLDTALEDIKVCPAASVWEHDRYCGYDQTRFTKAAKTQQILQIRTFIF
jgi:hypothetical protein